MRLWLISAVSVLLTAAFSAAHHTLEGVYDRGREQTVEGTVVEFQFVNPHPLVLLAVEGDGRRQTWRLEMDNRFELASIGMTATTLRPGDRLIATGGVRRDGAPGLYVRRLERPADGFWYAQEGSSPAIGGPRPR